MISIVSVHRKKAWVTLIEEASISKMPVRELSVSVLHFSWLSREDIVTSKGEFCSILLAKQEACQNGVEG